MSHSGVGKRAGLVVTGGVLVVGSAVGLSQHTAAAVTSTDEDGVTVTYSRQGYVGTTDDGLTYAPRPVAEFRAEACDLSSKEPAQVPAPAQLAVPGIGVEVPLGTSADLSSLPDAPEVVHYEGSALLGFEQGKTVIAGHVDYVAGKLSPFGQLHTIAPCDHIYVTDAEGQAHEYVLTDMYTVPQEQVEDAGIYTMTGDPALVLVTCSGPSVSDAGGNELFNYRYNLVLEAVPAEVSA
ncbi:LPXTG-site transpeptidase (sortase) family protein [Arthrobacter sp. CAN_A214]|uniref:class F sortase n=1 Tax=Arthrobacter sp. CAN_A214 TaxID=2787720 RepID=UPI0018CB3B2A